VKWLFPRPGDSRFRTKIRGKAGSRLRTNFRSSDAVQDDRRFVLLRLDQRVALEMRCQFPQDKFL
jgi:hypothetical protein